MESPCWSPCEGLQHGSRKPTETSVTKYCCEKANSSLEELMKIKVILFLIIRLFRQQNPRNNWVNFLTYMIALSAASLLNAVSRKRLEIQAFSFRKRKTLSLEVKICKFLASLTHYESKNSGGSTIRYFWIFVTSRKNSPSKRGQVQNLSSHKATTIRTLTRRAQLVCNSPDSIVKMNFICVKIKKSLSYQ